MPGTDIAYGPDSAMRIDEGVLDSMGMDLLSYDSGITHVLIRENGMKVAIVPSGNGNRMTLQRVVVGGSRLEDKHIAGMAHVLEHADFRSMMPGEGGIHTWENMRAIVGNAWTNMLGIGHVSSFLVHTAPTDEYHVDMAMQFQRDTALGRNLLRITPEALINEVQNVKDEGLYNSQYGAQPRNMIQENNRLLLKHIWNTGWTYPTIGTNAGQDIVLNNPARLIELHHQLRSPARTTLVLAGPIDPLKTLQLVKSLFTGAGDSVTAAEAAAGLRTLKDLYQNPHELRPIPTTRTQLEPYTVSSNISMNANTRGISRGFPAAPYGADTQVLQVIQQLVSIHAKHPAIAANGLEDVGMYFQPDAGGTVVSLLGTVNQNDSNEQRALTRAHQALSAYIIQPILNFNDSRALAKLMRQYRAMSQEATQSGPENTCGLAIQGIKLADTPSLMWHHDTLFSDTRITVEAIRRVAAATFNSAVNSTVCNTQFTGSAPPMPPPVDVVSNGSSSLMSSVSHLFQRVRTPGPVRFPAPLQTKQEVWDLAGPPSKTVRLLPQFSNRSSNANIRTAKLWDKAANRPLAVVAFNAIKALPSTQRRLTIVLGNVSEFGSWANASLVVSALATIAKAARRPGVKFQLTGGQLRGTVQDSAARPKDQSFVLPLVHTLAIAGALSRGVRVEGLTELAAQLPNGARIDAENEARKSYKKLVYMADAQIRSQAVTPVENGYVPATFELAVSELYTAKEGVMEGLRIAVAHVPTLAATNMSYPDILSSATMISKACSGLKSTYTVPELYKSPGTAEPPVVDMVQVPGLSTYPYTAAMRGSRALELGDRAALIVSNQLMVGGLGSVYSAAIRKGGMSYRPAGGVRLAWSAHPMITLNATFDASDRAEGQAVTHQKLRMWATGDSHAFTEAKFQTACTTVREQLEMRKMDFKSIEYDLLAHLDDNKLGTEQLVKQLDLLTLQRTTAVLAKYFGEGAIIMHTELVAKQ